MQQDAAVHMYQISPSLLVEEWYSSSDYLHYLLTYDTLAYMEDNIAMDLMNRVWECGLYSSGSEQCQVMRACKHDELLYSIKGDGKIS
jgi:hypothetical protein